MDIIDEIGIKYKSTIKQDLLELYSTKVSSEKCLYKLAPIKPLKSASTRASTKKVKESSTKLMTQKEHLPKEKA